MSIISRGYGFIKDIFDINPQYSPNSIKNAVGTLPSINFADEMPQVYDQLSIGSCQSNALGACIEYNIKTDETPSRLFLYYNARKLMGTINQDSGSTIQAVFQGAKQYGSCAETLWPYITPPDTEGAFVPVSEMYVCPPDSVYQQAHKDLLISMESINSMDGIKHALSNKIPVVFGMEVYDYFESAEMASCGVLRLPGSNEKLIGGHALVLVGFDDNKKTFTVRNSWSKNWGINGYFTAPYDYIENPDLAFQFRVLLKMEL